MQLHFLSLIERLTLDDIEILNTLTSQDSISRFSAQTKKNLITISKITESKVRKSIIRLEAMNFIEVVPGNREHLLFVTDFGKEAIQKIYDGSNA